MEVVEEITARYAGQPGMTLVALQEIQSAVGYIPEPAVPSLAKALGVPDGDIRGVVSFYTELRTTPPGRHRVCVCRGDSCAALGSHLIAGALEEQLGAAPGATTSDGEITHDAAFCLGNCALSPSISIDGEVYGRISPEDAVRRAREVANA